MLGFTAFSASTFADLGITNYVFSANNVIAGFTDSGDSGSRRSRAGGGGGTGQAISGNGNISWIATGTRTVPLVALQIMVLLGLMYRPFVILTVLYIV